MENDVETLGPFKGVDRNPYDTEMACACLGPCARQVHVSCSLSSCKEDYIGEYCRGF